MLYQLDHYIRCGEMPLYLIFYRRPSSQPSHHIMLCNATSLKRLLRKHKGFTNPKSYGHVVFHTHTDTPTDEMIAMLKSRFHFDLPRSSENTTDAFRGLAGI